MKIFTWRALCDILPTCASFNRPRGLILSNFGCVHCNVNIEDIKHALCECPWVVNLWSGASSEWSVKPLLVDGLKAAISSMLPPPSETFNAFLLLLWGIWHERNLVFHARAVLFAHIIIEIDSLILFRELVGVSTLQSIAGHWLLFQHGRALVFC